MGKIVVCNFEHFHLIVRQATFAGVGKGRQDSSLAYSGETRLIIITVSIAV